MIVQTFRDTVAAHDLLAAGDRVLAAVSGGGDSVALLRLLLIWAGQAPLTIVVAHVNHRIRGAAADEDQRFVENLATSLGLISVALSPDPEDPLLDRMRRGSEEASRLARHALLAGAARRTRCTRIALGHTMDDQAETILMRLMRGAGRRGLSGMAHRGPGRLIRPMLQVRRDHARSWLREIGQDFREDRTNEDPRFLRNRVRLQLVPLMREMSPAIVRVLARTAEVMAQEDRYLDELAADWVTRCARPAGRPGSGSREPGSPPALAVPSADLAGLPAALARRAARLLLRAAGGDPRGTALSGVEALLDQTRRVGEGGSRELAGGMRVWRDGRDLVVARVSAVGLSINALANKVEPFSVEMLVPGDIELPGPEGRMEARVLPRSEVTLEGTPARKACLDADLLGSVVTVRSRLPGDLFHPLGAAGRRKLKEFMIDRKIPRRMRVRIPLVVGPAGIAWVAGQRIGHPFRLTEATRRVAVLEYKPRVDQAAAKH